VSLYEPLRFYSNEEEEVTSQLINLWKSGEDEFFKFQSISGEPFNEDIAAEVSKLLVSSGIIKLL
jgi:hypothetical protein